MSIATRVAEMPLVMQVRSGRNRGRRLPDEGEVTPDTAAVSRSGTIEHDEPVSLHFMGGGCPPCLRCTGSTRCTSLFAFLKAD